MTDATPVAGTTELKDLLIGLNELSLELIKVFKDGVQIADAVKVFEDIQSNPALKAKLVAAVGNIQAIPAEIKSFNLAEGLDLLMTEVQYIPQIIDALK